MHTGFRGGCRFLAAVVLAVAAVVLLAGAPAGAQDRDFAPVTDAMLQDPDPADWLNWRRTLDGWGYSPLDQIDRGNVHRLQLAWAWSMPAGVNQPTPLVYGGVMYPRRSGQRRAGGGRRDRRPRLGVPARPERVGRVGAEPAQPVDRDLRRQGVPERGRRPHRRPRCAHRRRGVGPRGRRQRARLPVHERPHRRQREGRGRHDRVRALQGGRLLHLGPRRRDRGGAVAHVDHRAPRRPRRRHLGRSAAAVPRRRRLLDSRQLRPGQQPHVLVDLAGEAVGQPDPRHRRRRALQQQRAGARRGHRRAVVVLPVLAGRDARSRRCLRERTHRPRRAPVAVQDGEARHPVAARPRHGRVRRRPRSRLPGCPRRRPPGPGERPTGRRWCP